MNNFNSSGEKYAERRQQELALSWDRIERGLQNDSFWLFLNETDTYETRIDFLFQLLSESYNKALPEANRINIPQYIVQYNKTFLIYYASYKHAEDKNAFVIDLWKKIEGLYERFQEWYADLNKYHVIGFLIASGVSIKDIFILTDGKRKSEMLSDLIKETKKKVPIDCEETLRKKSYADNKKDLRRLFLLFNIATLYCKNEKQYRFPFDLYKKDKWDIEHIHATADDSDIADDSLGNLTLLSAEINRSYKDKPFHDKRNEIRNRDSRGMFIPVCTKNLFHKQYSETIDTMDNWNDHDKESYIKAIYNTLVSFWEGV